MLILRREMSTRQVGTTLVQQQRWTVWTTRRFFGTSHDPPVRPPWIWFYDIFGLGTKSIPIKFNKWKSFELDVTTSTRTGSSRSVGLTPWIISLPKGRKLSSKVSLPHSLKLKLHLCAKKNWICSEAGRPQITSKKTRVVQAPMFQKMFIQPVGLFKWRRLHHLLCCPYQMSVRSVKRQHRVIRPRGEVSTLFPAYFLRLKSCVISILWV